MRKIPQKSFGEVAIPRKNHIPSYHLHKQSSQAIVTLSDGMGNRQDVLLGEFNSPESLAMYDRVISEWTANRLSHRSRKGHDITITELILGFWEFAENYFGFGKKPKRQDEDCFKDALRIAKDLYGSSAKDFGPLALKACRAVMVEKGWSRNYVNAQTERIRRIFKWAAEEELIPGSQYRDLRLVASLRWPLVVN